MLVCTATTAITATDTAKLLPFIKKTALRLVELRGMFHPRSLAVLVAAAIDESWSAARLQELSASNAALPFLNFPPRTQLGWAQYANAFYVALCRSLGVEFARSLPAVAGIACSVWALLAQRTALAQLHLRAQAAQNAEASSDISNVSTSPCGGEGSAFTVCIVAKLPREGRSKTRLARSMRCMGGAHAQRAASFTHAFAQSSLLDCVEMYARLPECSALWALPGSKVDAAALLVDAGALLAACCEPPSAVLVANPHGMASIDVHKAPCEQPCPCPADTQAAQCSLGGMLSVTCSHVAACRPGAPLVLLGMDAPHLPVCDVRRACHVSRSDNCAVLLPSSDGGFVALVLPPAAVLAASHHYSAAAVPPHAAPWRCGALFDAVGLAGKWSTSDAAAAQAAALQAAGVPVRVLRRAKGGGDEAAYIDIDTWEDLAAAAPQCTAEQAPRVAALLAQLRGEGLLS